METFESAQETSQAQGFLPIVATLLFAAATLPMLLGWRSHEVSIQWLDHSVPTARQVLLAKGEIGEFRHSDERCYCRCN